MSLPGKQKGYRGEIVARDELRYLGLVHLERTGSVAYHKDAADLVQPNVALSEHDLVRIIATQDDRQPMLYTLTAFDLGQLLGSHPLAQIPVVVQVKKRKATWIGSLYRALKAATS